MNLNTAPTKAPESEINTQLNELEAARSRIQAVFDQLSERLDRAGVLAPAMAEPAELAVSPEACVVSPLGTRIRNIRRELNGIASEADRLIAHLAI